MRRAALFAAAAIMAIPLAAAPAHAAKRTVPHGFYGAIYTVDGAPPAVVEATWNRMAAAGVESARAVFHWGHAQRNRGDAFNFQRTDATVRATASRGMSVVPTVMYAPPWAKRFPNIPQSPPARIEDYTAFVAALVRRYGPRGSFWVENPSLPKRPLRHWQIWNEPTLKDHWWREDPWLPNEVKRYGALVRASRRAARREDKGAQIVIGGLTNFAWDTLAELYRYAGLRGHFDVAAVHMFPGKWRNVSVIIERFRKVLDRNGGRNLPIWVTEMTWPAAEGRAPVPEWAQTPYYKNFVTTEKGAANRLRGSYELLGQRGFRTRNKLQRVLWYSATTSFSGGWIFDYSGLMSLNGSTLVNKPAYDAFRASARAAQGCAKDKRGACR